MKQLVLALYAEGTTDQLFLPSIIQRTTIQVLRQHEHQQINVLTPRAVHLEKAPATRDECILQAAREASDSNILIVHADADHLHVIVLTTSVFCQGKDLFSEQAQVYAPI